MNEKEEEEEEEEEERGVKRGEKREKKREERKERAPVVAEREREGSLEGEAMVGRGVRRDEGHGHEVVHKMELLGPGKLDASGKAEREKRRREWASGGLQRHRSRHVEIPKPTAVGRPSQLLHPLQSPPTRQSLPVPVALAATWTTGIKIPARPSNPNPKACSTPRLPAIIYMKMI